MADTYDTSTTGVIDSIGTDDMSADTQDRLTTFLDDVTNTDGDLKAQDYDGGPVSGDTDVLNIGAGNGELNLTAADLGNARVVNASGSDSGIKIDLSDDSDSSSTPADRMIIGSSSADEVTTGGGDDTLALGGGDDIVRIGGTGNVFLDGGAGDGDTLVLSAGNWSQLENEDGTTTYHNEDTGQDVTVVNVEHVEYGETLSAPQIDDLPDDGADDF